MFNNVSKGIQRKALALTFGAFASMQAHAVMMDFDFAHGTVISDQYAGVTISADGRNTDYAVVYDTSPRVGEKRWLNNHDRDLVGPISGSELGQ